jgi:hypothetical protein
MPTKSPTTVGLCVFLGMCLMASVKKNLNVVYDLVIRCCRPQPLPLGQGRPDF